MSETYSGINVRIPVHVRRGREDGPVVFVTAAVHGDEVNGTGAIHRLLRDPHFRIRRGAVIFVPVANPLAFDRHSRYMPDRRDLNRCFPGRAGGSLTSRLAHTIFEEIVRRSDAGIDLHTAAVRRTNYPTVRGDLSIDGVHNLAQAFGTELVLNRQGPDGSFRREACNAGCPVIALEAGEVLKVEPAITQLATRGIKRVLVSVGLMDASSLYEPEGDDTAQDASRKIPIIMERTTWVRADAGGFLTFAARPGDLVKTGQILATASSLLGQRLASGQGEICSPVDGIVIGMSTLPAARPGTPVFHIGELPGDVTLEAIRQRRTTEPELQDQIRSDLASNINVPSVSLTPDTP